MNDFNDDSAGALNAADIRDIKLTFAQVAAMRYRDLVADTCASAIEHGHMSPQAAIAVLLQIAAITATAKLGTNEGAALIELMAHQLAERMKQPRPLTN